MVHQSVIHARMSQLGIKVSSWYKPELKELSLLLMDNEEIISLLTGRYYGGFALLVATDRRLLLIDKKTMFMSLEDIRYDMISEIDYSSRVFDATITVFTVNKQHKFTSMKHKDQMRHLTVFVQKRIMELRQPQTADEYIKEMDENEQEAMYTASSNQRKGISQHLRTVGTAAIHGANTPTFNPYTRTSLTTKNNWSGLNDVSPIE